MAERAESLRSRPIPTSAATAAVAFEDQVLVKARWCRRRLLAWYDLHGRHFPWRSPDAGLYQQVVAEVLLQRTQASTVGRFFDAFFDQFNGWGDIDVAPQDSLESALRPIGLWRRRATALKALAREMVTRRGKFPGSRDELESLPAVGQYVASAVLLFAHGRTEPLLDANMARVLDRVFAPRRLVDIRYDPRLQALARLLVRSRKPAVVNWAILDFAALQCTARSPQCETCVLQHRCNFARTAQPSPKLKGRLRSKRP
ncbi:A/G-specific adenine glycosylase [Bradyrhizobium sp. i1.4.4]